MTIDVSAWIGRAENRSETVAREPFARFNAMLDRAPEPDMAATPPLGHWLCFQPDFPQSSLGPDGHGARGDFYPPLDLPMRMWAGARVRFHAPIPLGARITRRSAIASITQKSGRTGPLAFVTLRHEIFHDTTLCLTDENDLVFRTQSADGAAPAGERRAAQVTRAITPTSALLFRYSALTFNAHRIHYDRDYTRDVEGYPGLLVHGPLLATLLVDHFRRHAPDATIAAVSFRAKRPVFDLAPFTVNLNPTPTGAALWAADSDGFVAMEATLETA